MYKTFINGILKNQNLMAVYLGIYREF